MLHSKIKPVKQLRHSSLGVKHRMRVPYLVVRSSNYYFSSKYVRWLYDPSEKHITTYRYFFVQQRKTVFKLANRATFEIAKSLICFKFHSSLKNFSILGQMVTCTISGTCHHEVGSAWFNSFNDVSFQNLALNRTQKLSFRGKTIECEYDISWFAPQTFIFPQNMSDGYMSRQRDI